MPIRHKSGAFFQQCFSVHPLCLVLKSSDLSRGLRWTCTSCKFAHRLKLGELRFGGATAMAPPTESPETLLQQCLTSHPDAIRLRGLDVEHSLAGVRCGECRRLYDLSVTEFETLQP